MIESANMYFVFPNKYSTITKDIQLLLEQWQSWTQQKYIATKGLCSDGQAWVQVIWEEMSSYCRIYTSVNWINIISDNGLSPIRRQAII